MRAWNVCIELRDSLDKEDAVKKVVVFGAGLVASAHVKYLLEHGYQVTVASRTVSKAKQIVGSHPNGRPVAFDIETEGDSRLDEIVLEHDLAVSLLPYVYHTRVAKSCVRHRKHMVTTSYVKPEMQALDAEAKAAGVALLNELGVDPGIDHMTAMKVIHRVKAAGGTITRFTSYCGGLPAPEANDNPFGYKFSWSPRGVLMAGRNPARFRQDGELVEIPGPDLFLHYWCVPIEVEGKVIPFEGYPNRDSLPYAETYGITEARTMFRGTLRNQGWCPTLKKVAELGLLEETEMDLSGLTYAQFMAKLIGKKSPRGVKQAVARKIGLDPINFIIANLEWLGLFSSAPLPAGCKSPLDVLNATTLAKMSYAPGERDLLVLQHQFVAEYPDHKEKISSTMIDFGIPSGDSSMNRTVGLPAAVGVRLILEGQVKSRGVLVPVLPEIYEPALVELERLGIQFTEKTERI
ncbi:MAG TPA: saccharopine dehydrogenase C-terminal domain-containing protein [Thermoanaerobaculaceae bacterium]|nr:saccharopine dehydrogenase C-terminal domain-containing protein [Thermoanaerobaculaceae bacterium]